MASTRDFRNANGKRLRLIKKKFRALLMGKEPLTRKEIVLLRRYTEVVNEYNHVDFKAFFAYQREKNGK